MLLAFKIFLVPLLIIFILGKPFLAYSQSPKPGRAPFAIQNSNYNCDALISSLTTSNTKEIRYSWLYNTFNNTSGDGLDCVRKINALPNTTFMQVHLINEVCQRNKNCGEYELLYGISTKEFRRGLKNRENKIITKIESYIKASATLILPTLNDKITCAVSPGLESNLDKKSALVLLEITKKYFGERCKLVWNPVGDNKFGIAPIEGTIHELHGPKPRLKSPCIANLDGIDIELPHRKSIGKLGAISLKSASKYLKDHAFCEASFLWIAEENCIEKGKFKDPRARTNCSGAKEHESLNGLMGGH